MDIGSTKTLLELHVKEQTIVPLCRRNLLNKPIYGFLCQLILPLLKLMTIGLPFLLLLSLEKL